MKVGGDEQVERELEKFKLKQKLAILSFSERGWIMKKFEMH